MTRKTKALSGASQDAYFRRVLKTYPSIPDEARERIVHRLRKEIAQLRVRPSAREEAEAAAAQTLVAPADGPAPKTADAPPCEEATAQAASVADSSPSTFDPFALNVIVTLRTAGRDAALEALTAIGDTANLKLLAREQRLSIGEDLGTPAELSAAIIAAAERRLANRRAAAGSR